MLVHWHQPHLFKITMLTETNCMAWRRQDIQGNIGKIFKENLLYYLEQTFPATQSLVVSQAPPRFTLVVKDGWSVVIANISIIMIIMMISPSSTLSPWSLIIANMPTKVTLRVWAPYLCQVQLQVQAAPAPGAPSTEEKLPRIASWILHVVDL